MKTNSSAIKPSGQAPQWAPNIKPEMQAVIEKLESYKDTPIPQLTAFVGYKSSDTKPKEPSKGAL